MKYPPEYFSLEAELEPVAARIAILVWEAGFPAAICRRLSFVNGLLFDLIDDDLLGLIDATPEERVRLALEIAEAGHD
ncbi:MAG: hypothetical protein AAFY03_04310 [Pseudomonadota bacterium]